MKVLIIGATHGTEALGPKLYARLLLNRSPLLEHIDFIIGNPRAYANKKRYIDRDLNRCYQNQGEAYEERRAKEITEYINDTQPDLVIDMHTTTCRQPNCLIIGSLKGEMKQRFLRASHIDTVLQVQPMGDIATLHNAVVAYEIPNRAVTPNLLDAIAADLERFVSGESISHRKTLYSMSDKIYKKDVTRKQAKTFVNFEMHQLGFVPIMTGNNSYKKQTDYLGFKAAAPQEITL